MQDSEFILPYLDLLCQGVVLLLLGFDECLAFFALDLGPIITFIIDIQQSS